MKKKIVIGSLALVGSLVGGNAFAQNAPACRPPQAYCEALAGRNTFSHTVLPAAASLSECTMGTQSPIGDCDASWLRRDRTNSSVYASAGVAQIRPGQQFTVQAIPGPRTYVTQRDPRYAGVHIDIGNLQQDVRALDANDELETFQRRAADRVLMANQRELLRRNDATNTHVNNVEWRVGDLREEFRVRFMVPMRYTWQPGGSPTLGVGVGFGLTRWGQGSSLGIDGDVNFHAYEYQPAAPGATPLFGATFGLHMVVGRGMVQGLVGASGGTAFRFGDAGPGQVTGGTQFNLGLGGGIRLEAPFYPTSRPGGARIFGQLLTHLGGGAVNAVVAGQPPLHAGFVLDLQVAIGVAL